MWLRLDCLFILLYDGWEGWRYLFWCLEIRWRSFNCLESSWGSINWLISSWGSFNFDLLNLWWTGDALVLWLKRISSTILLLIVWRLHRWLILAHGFRSVKSISIKSSVEGASIVVYLWWRSLSSVKELI